MPFIPAEPRLRHWSLNRSTGSLACLECSIFLHFCLISVSDLDVAAMLLSIVCNKYGALRESRRFYFSVTLTTSVVSTSPTGMEPWAQNRPVSTKFPRFNYPGPRGFSWFFIVLESCERAEMRLVFAASRLSCSSLMRWNIKKNLWDQGTFQ